MIDSKETVIERKNHGDGKRNEGRHEGLEIIIRFETVQKLFSIHGQSARSQALPVGATEAA